jgi:hypothetical protein
MHVLIVRLTTRSSHAQEGALAIGKIEGAIPAKTGGLVKDQ